MTNSIPEVPHKNLELYNKVVGSNSQIERKGKATPYTSLNGHMFSFLSKEGVMGLRLSKKDREDFIQNFDSKLMEQHGRIMKEFVEIPYILMKNTEELSAYLQKSLDYVSELKPKSRKNKI